MNSYCAREMLLFTGNSHPDLARSVASRLGIRMGNCTVYQRSNRESRVEVGESVRGKDVFILQTGSKDVNDAIMELQIIAYACKTSCAHRIIGVIPYLPYSKQCKMRKRGSVVSKLLATLLCRSGLDHVITMDLHQREIQGFFDIPVDNLRASPFLIQHILENIPDFRNAVIVAKTPASARKAQSFAERLRLGIAVIHGEPQEADSDRADGRNSPPLAIKNDPDSQWKDIGQAWSPVLELPDDVVVDEVEDVGPPDNVPSRNRNISTTNVGMYIPPLTAKEKPPIDVVGNVRGKIAIIVDDIIDDMETFVAAADALKDRGACKVYVMATHGLLSSHAPEILEESIIDGVVVTNTVPHELQKLQCSKISTVDISSMLSEAIRRIHHGESMSHLFRNIAFDD